ncbi:cytochrome b/b6 domain-containing protein [Streptomyces mexicanus]|uniref:cytochrome b/b6 domain-containing protein n=1 Tax=Streptomyces mexicanus TaxID=178566 RepID=UPI0031EF0054
MNRRRSTSSLPKPGRSAYGVASAVALLLIPVVVLAGGSQFREFLNFGAGVLSLVCLSCSVIWGLVAQDRIVLNTRQRIVGQAVHRTTAVASIAFLLLHITTKIALEHTEVIAAVVPFSLGVTGIGGLIGLGSLAGLLMVFVGITGALRGTFATPAPVAARWRAMHMLAYPAWCAALVHGLYAGRQAKPVFVILYALSLLGVMGALALRSAPRPVKRRIADRVARLLDGGERPERAGLAASRTRAAESALPGYDTTRAARRAGATGPLPGAVTATPRYDTPTTAPAPHPAPGFAAAYRAVSAPARAQQPFVAEQPYPARPTFAAPQPYGAPQPYATQQPFAAEQTARPQAHPDTGGWPVPSPPPVGEAPPSAYDPLRDTGPSVPRYAAADPYAHGGRDVHDIGETNHPSGAYHPNDTYTSGPATETLPGTPFGAPDTGEPWNTPSGGHR